MADRGKRRGQCSIPFVVIALAASVLTGAPAGAATKQKRVAVGAAHFCALSTTGIVKCWGNNSVGQVGNGTESNAGVKTPVRVLTGATAIAAGDYHSCALMANAAVKCWGTAGTVGNGTTTDVTKPANVKGVGGSGLGVKAITAAGLHSCALLKNGTAKCWGQNNYGTLGNGSTTNAATPVIVKGLTGATGISMSAQVSCATLQSGKVKCWGYTGNGQLGVRTPGPESCEFGDFASSCSTTPRTVKGVSNAARVSVAQNHICALLTNKTVECWGANSVTPIVESGLTGVLQLSTNGYQRDKSCALVQNRTVKCFQYHTATKKPAPKVVGNLSGVAFVDLGGLNDCAVLVAGSVKCWADNNTSHTQPKTVSGL